MHIFRAEVICINIECPSLFRGPPEPGCRLLYTPGKCCSTGEECRKYFLSKINFYND